MKQFSIQTLAENLETIPEIDFALLFGSSQSDFLGENSDIDIGVYLNSPVTPDDIDPQILFTIITKKINEFAAFIDEIRAVC